MRMTQYQTPTGRNKFRLGKLIPNTRIFRRRHRNLRRLSRGFSVVAPKTKSGRVRAKAGFEIAYVLTVIGSVGF
jgi:hypothetical protein